MFEGFSQEALDFLNDIRFNNNQTFYEANKARYERYVKQPMRELSDELAPVVQLIDPKLDTRPGRTMSRIRRDTRYTKDKSPFRDHAWLGWRYPGEGRGEGFHMYWGFGPDWLGWGCGCYYTDKPLMDALRLHIRRESDDVRRCLKALDGRFEPYGEDYKKLAVPDDVPEDLRFLYVKKYFGFERNGTQAEWALLHTRGVVSAQAHYWRGRVTITYDPNIVTEDTLRQELTNAGYPPGTHGMGGVVVDGICLALVGVLYSGLPKLLALVKVPALADNASLGLVFLVGLLTSTHCIGMCGGILLAQTTDARGVTARSKRGLIASAAYNGGRVVSYTAVGALCGALGAVMSGTGSAVFGIFADADSAVYAKRRLARDYAECFLTETIDRLEV